MPHVYPWDFSVFWPASTSILCIYRGEWGSWVSLAPRIDHTWQIGSVKELRFPQQMRLLEVGVHRFQPPYPLAGVILSSVFYTFSHSSPKGLQREGDALITHTVTECKPMCLPHSEAKQQTKTSEFGAQKGVLQNQARRLGSLEP